MKYRRLGASGLEVSPLCLGCMSYGKTENATGHDAWTLDEETSRPFLKRSIELGINFFDTADGYGQGRSEEVLGRALKDYARRDEIVIATKVFAPMKQAPNSAGLSRKHIMAACDASLQRLGTDFIDVYQIHRWDINTPVEETLAALEDLVRAGKVLHIGASSMFSWQFSKMLAIQERAGWTKFISMQPQYNLIYREEEREMLPLCQDQGIGVIPWSPLARGFLAGNRNAADGGETSRSKGDMLARRMYYQPSDFAVVARLHEVAEARGMSNMKIALAWVASRPGVTAPIIGATKMSHLDDAIEALEIVLEPGEITRLEECYLPHPVLGHGYGNPIGNAAGTPQRTL